MSLKRLGIAEFVGISGALLLVLSLWIPWFKTDPTNPNSKIDALVGKVNAWDAFQTLPLFLIITAVVPFLLTWLVLTGQEGEWSRGEITVIAGAIAFLLVFGNGILFGRPGAAPVDVQLWWGYLLALIAPLLIAAGGILRQSESPPPPEPPGV